MSPKLSPWLLGLVLTALSLSPAAALEQRRFEHTFPLTQGQSVRLANVAGSVELVAGGGNEVKVVVSVHGEKKVQVEALEFVQHTDSRGELVWALSYPVGKYRTFHYPALASRSGDWDGGFFGSLLNSIFGNTSGSEYLGRRVEVTSRPSGSTPTLWADLHITVPRVGHLEVRTLAGAVRGGALAGSLMLDTSRAGSVELTSFDGNLHVDTGSGSVRLGRVDGELLVDTGSGSIDVEDLRGSATLDTGSGSVSVARVDADRLLIDTGSGGVSVSNGRVGELIADTGSGGVKILDVEIETFRGDTGSGGVTLRSSLDSAREVDIDTGSGRIQILAGANADFEVDASVGSGGLRVGYADATLRRDGNEVVGATRGTGRTRIRVDTGSGGCEIRPSA